MKSQLLELEKLEKKLEKVRIRVAKQTPPTKKGPFDDLLALAPKFSKKWRGPRNAVEIIRSERE